MTPDEFAGKYVTEAVESTVRNRDRETVGHVGLLDLDDVDPEAAASVADQLPGTAVVLSTSARSHHVWSLAVLPLDAWLDRLAPLSAVDGEHLALSERRECAVLRVDAKVGVETGDVVKPAPRLRDVRESETERPQSRPHARVLREEFDVSVDVEESEAGTWVGHSAPRRSYMADIGGRSTSGGGDR